MHLKNMIFTILLNYVYTSMENQLNQQEILPTNDNQYTFCLNYVDETGEKIEEKLNCVFDLKNHFNLVKSHIFELTINPNDKDIIKSSKFGLTFFKNDDLSFNSIQLSILTIKIGH